MIPLTYDEYHGDHEVDMSVHSRFNSALFMVHCSRISIVIMIAWGYDHDIDDDGVDNDGNVDDGGDGVDGVDDDGDDGQVCASVWRDMSTRR